MQEKEDQRGTIVLVPVFWRDAKTETIDERRAALVGYVSGVLRLGDVLAQSQATWGEQGLNVRLLDVTQEQVETLASYSSDDSRPSEAAHASRATADIGIGGRVWRLEVWPTRAWLTAHRPWEAYGFLAGGFLLMSLLGALLLSATGRVAVVESIVTERTAALREETEQRLKAAEMLEEMNLQLAHASRTDALTQVFNRGAWIEAMEMEHQRSVRFGHRYAVLILDADYFKKLNDSLGHKAGDECLQRLARVVKETCRDIDVVGRYGGEEFVVLCPETTDAGARQAGERIRAALHAENIPHPQTSTGDRVSMSIGVAAWRLGDDWPGVVARADEALYEAKRQGRNRVCSLKDVATVGEASS